MKRVLTASERLDRSDRFLRRLAFVTAGLLLILGVLTLVNVTRIYSQLLLDVEDHRHETEETIKAIQAENKKLAADNKASHDEQIRFVKCILLLAGEQRTEAEIQGCIEQAENADISSSDNTPNVAPADVNEVTPSPTPSAPSPAPPPPPAEQPPAPVPFQPLDAIVQIVRRILPI